MRYKCILFITIVIASFSSCTKKEKATEATNSDDFEWVEMDSFHLLMAEAFHPYKDSSNLDPIKQLAEELAQEAEKWASAPLPDQVTNDEMKARLNLLKNDTRALSMMIQDGASDEEIATALQNLHNSFHTIMEAWSGGHHEHGS